MTCFNYALLVDDDDTTNFLHEHLLRLTSLSHHIRAFTDPKAALRFLEHHWHAPSADKLPDVLLLDINMPGLDGFEFLDALLATGQLPGQRVFLLSSSSNAADRERAQQYPLAGYLIKPLDEQQLRQILPDTVILP